MRNEKGYFCSLTIDRSVHAEEIWFGPQKSKGLENQRYENITTNGITLFPTPEDAEQILPALTQGTGFKAPYLGYMEIDIAETDEDSNQIKQGSNVVLINTTDGPNSDLLGPVTADKEDSSLYPFVSERLTINGGVPFDTYPTWIAHHDGRQGGRITLATLVDFRKPVEVGGYYQLPLKLP